MNKTENYKRNREVLKSMSRKARLIRETQIAKAVQSNNEEMLMYWSNLKINDILMKVLYKKGEAKVFNTFFQWKAENKIILKGSKAIVIWGQPRTKTQEVDGKEIDEYSFYPLCYLFSNLQVTDR
jgi:hypothetical protein